MNEQGQATNSRYVSIGRRRLFLGVGTLAALTLLSAGIAVLLANPPWGSRALPALDASLNDLDSAELQDEKLRKEIIDLELKNRSETSAWRLVLGLVPFTTALAAVAGVFITVWKYQAESARQRHLDREERDRENQRRFDQNFTKVVENLGGERSSLRASAAISLMTFLKPEYSSFHDQVYLVVLANLKIEQDEAVTDSLVRVFEQAIRLRLLTLKAGERRDILNLSRAQLERVDLSDLDLSEADLGFTRLRGANLTGATLRRARGIGVNLENARLSRANLTEARFRDADCRNAQFHEATLVSARLDGKADLRNAEFQQARLQSAHLTGAKLGGARFEGANLRDTFFEGALLDRTALRSIARGARESWQQAHFDNEVQAQLSRIAGISKMSPETVKEK
jgi:hypothetical protein